MQANSIESFNIQFSHFKRERNKIMSFEKPIKLLDNNAEEEGNDKTETSKIVSEKINQLCMNTENLRIIGEEISKGFKSIGVESSNRQEKIVDKFKQMQKDYTNIEKLHKEEEEALRKLEIEEENLEKLKNRGVELLEKLKNDFEDYKSKETVESK